MAKEKEEKKGKKKTWLYVLIMLLVLVVAFLLWWFLRTFPVTFKYNNGMEDYTVRVRYLNKIKQEDVKEGLTREGYYLDGYYETYYLSGEEIEKVKSDAKAAETICKEHFTLNNDKTKCIADDKFDFVNTKIKKKTTIELLWYKQGPAPVDSSVKITSKSNCAIGTNAVTLTANITGSAKVKEWNVPSCYTDTKVDDKTIKVTRNGNCPNNAISKDTIKVTLTDGKTASYTLNYEPQLKVTVYGDSNNVLSVDNGTYYYAKYIRTNIKSTFSITSPNGKFVGTTTDTEAWFDRGSDTTINAKTACGQSESVHLAATIN